MYVSATGVQRIRTTAESHRRIAIVEVMGRHSGYLALGPAYGQPDMVLIPESPLNVDRLVERVIEIYDLQKNVVIVCAEGIVDENGQELAPNCTTRPIRPATKCSAAPAKRCADLLIERLGDSYFTSKRRNESARAAIFTRKVGHTQRGGRPVLFDSFLRARSSAATRSICCWKGTSTAWPSCIQPRTAASHVGGINGNDFRDRWGLIHARQVHPSFYDAERLGLSRTGVRLPAADLQQRGGDRRHGIRAANACSAAAT